MSNDAHHTNSAPLYSQGQPRVPVDRVAMSDEQVIARAVAVVRGEYVMFDKTKGDQ